MSHHTRSLLLHCLNFTLSWTFIVPCPKCHQAEVANMLKRKACSEGQRMTNEK